ncbi:bifunctional ABC transporter [Serinicoccus hydrothermalis]|uniref:Bifunctional ABC transporter n=1 Tax=Serinicoccus hydrothermalis TaxID=1758689 RepID=A0A1B1N8U7_9MICO|nr:ABC transporter ATP-binding protein [Serinicoccus hydrothermalis]ANS77849.1 bifunctional ABC transporter [Serinicoccus hydrothermalis]
MARAAAAHTPGSVVRLAFSRSRGGAVLCAVMVSVHQVCEASTPVIVGLALDDAVAQGSVSRTWMWLALLAAVYAVLSLCGNGAGPVGVRAATRAEHDVRQAVVARVLDRHGSQLGRQRSTGERLSIASSDASQVGRAVDALAVGTSGAAALLVASTALFLISPLLGLVAVGSVVLVVFVAPFLARPLQTRSAAQQEAAAGAAEVAVDLVSGLRVLGGLGAGRPAAQRYREVSQVSRHARVRAGATESVFEGITTTIGGFLLIAVASVGALLTLDGDITPGQLVAGVGLAQFLVGPVQRLAATGALVASVRASAGRIAELLDTPVAVEDGDRGDDRDPARLPATVEVRDLRGAHLDGLDLTVGPGEVVGVVVDDLGARTELLDALARRRAPAAGSLVVGGRPATDLPLETLDRHLVVPPHEGSLFTETLTEMLGGTGGRALEAAQAQEVGGRLAQDGVLHGGRNLSGGQRQRLSLARALAADPPLLVLDDPTSALDPVTESAVADGLRELRSGARSTLLVTGSPTLLSTADWVVLVQGGRAVLTGTHTECSTDPRYAAVVLS